MKCPNCNATLVMADRSGVEIDYCPECRGVWLDRGELDKIIERSTQFAQPSAPAPAQPQQPRYDEREYRHKDDYKNKPYKKRDSFLGDLFDF